MTFTSAIPTVYRGRRFRSRLEAKWAAFFDLLKWRWDYEPFDRAGWIPDFVLRGAGGIVLVEVKPVADSDDPIFIDARRDVVGNLRELEEGLIVSWHLPQVHEKQIACGWLYDRVDWALAPFGLWDNAKTFGFCHENNWFRDRISGCYDGGCFGSAARDDEASDWVSSLWVEAGNKVQWRSQL